MIRSLALTALTLVAASPALATGPVDTSHVRPGGQVCYEVYAGPDQWTAGNGRPRTESHVCYPLQAAPGLQAVTAPPRVARLPRR
ncbi:MAG: hypothetical protein KDK12_20685 [Rhodobacteraceae bacterium]|nr:hypothetical protein [Paracoccaceae bacterium]